ncbi:MAG: ATP-binding protein [Candidatus Hydrogenedentes bacterium]|nr:ATP-binding protein [Candidatus Hydrogenedentota bacterium]
MFERNTLQLLITRTAEARRFIQVLAGSRQTGKTTLARQLIDAVSFPTHYATADEPALKDTFWIEQQWDMIRRESRNAMGLLVLDEIQKLSGWFEMVKRLWDEDTATGQDIQVVILGSSALLVQRGLSESLAGRFEVIPITHWTYPEMRGAFGWGLEEYIFYGGYPGAAPLIHEPARWARYVRDSLIETSVSRDVLLMARVDKPVLLRRVFELGCAYSGRILSFQKMVGQLQDAGNTTTLAHYIELLAGAGLVRGLQKYAGQAVRRRASSPKLLAMNTALISALSGSDLQGIRANPEAWGRLVESAVGANLVNGIAGTGIELCYWSSGNLEVDYVLCQGERLVAIEVKSGRRRDTLPGLREFCRHFPRAKPLLVGADGVPLEEFFQAPASSWLASV